MYVKIAALIMKIYVLACFFDILFHSLSHGTDFL